MRRGIANMMKKKILSEPTNNSASRKGMFEILFSAVLIIIFSILLISYRKEIESLSSFGYLGVFILSLVSAATIFIPAPGLFLSASTGLFLNPILVGICGGLGAAIGESTGYMVGKGISDLRHNAIFNISKKIIEKYGIYAVAIFAAIPNPFFDVVGIAAGILKIPPKQFFIAVLIGNIFKYFVVSLMFSMFGEAILSYL